MIRALKGKSGQHAREVENLRKNWKEMQEVKKTLQLKQKKCVYRKMWHGEERISELEDR